MVKLFLARHGQDEDNACGLLNGHRDLPLTSLGLQQAQTLAHRIAERGLAFDEVYTSPLQRTRQTADVVCRTLNLTPPVVKHALIERDFGTMTGKHRADIERLCAPDIIKLPGITYFLSPPGAETFEETFVRARRVLAQIHAAHANGTVLLVTHGDIGKMLCAAHYGLPWNEALTRIGISNAELLELGPPAD